MVISPTLDFSRAISSSWSSRSRSFRVEGNGPKRFSVQRKMAVVARLLRGEPLELVARDANVSIARLTEWRERALAGAATTVAMHGPTGFNSSLSGPGRICPGKTRCLPPWSDRSTKMEDF
jgi:hypothetical protein